jgi:hypothetical protein
MKEWNKKIKKNKKKSEKDKRHALFLSKIVNGVCKKLI